VGNKNVKGKNNLTTNGGEWSSTDALTYLSNHGLDERIWEAA
jgi:hypothetical protein